MNDLPEPSPGATASQPTVRILGLGGAGLNAVGQMAQGDLRDLSFAGLHTNGRVLELSSLAERVLLGRELLHGLGTGGDPALGKAAAEEASAELARLWTGADLIFLVTGLGGGTGTGAAPVLARAAKAAGALVLGIAALPFDFEGQRRQQQAEQGLQRLKAAADAVICLPNQKAFKLIDERTSVSDTFRLTNELLAEAVRGIWRMLTEPGLIKVGFADLATVTRGRHAESSFATARAEGEGRSRQVVEKLLASPLLDEGRMLEEAETLLVHVAGGPDLTLAEVDRVMDQIHRRAEAPKVVMGASIHPTFAGALTVTLIAGYRSSGREPDGRLDRRPELQDPAVDSDGAGLGEIDSQFFTPSPVARPVSRFVPPAPVVSDERARQLLGQRRGRRRSRESGPFWRQGQLQLEIISKGRFEKSEPTVHRGEDLDVPTYVRRGVVLN